MLIEIDLIYFPDAVSSYGDRLRQLTQNQRTRLWLQFFRNSFKLLLK